MVTKVSSLAIQETLLNGLENGIIILGEDLIVCHWNRWLEIHTQIYAEDLIGKSISSVFPKIKPSILQRKIKTTLALNTATFFESDLSQELFPIKRHNLTHANFPLMQMKITIAPYDLAKGQALISLYDVSEVYELKEALAKEIEKVSALNTELWHDKQTVESTVILSKIDCKGRIIESSQALLRQWHYSSNELADASLATLFQKDISSETLAEMLKELHSNKVWHKDVLCQSQNKESFWMNIKAIPLFDSHGSLASATLIFQDSSDKKKLEELSLTDPLTNIYNKNKFDELLDKNLSFFRNDDRELSLIFMEIDDFKSVHAADQLLIFVSQEVKSLIRSDDIFIRWEDATFLLILKHTSLTKSIVIAEKIQNHLNSSSSAFSARIELSFGISSYHENESKDSFLQRAYDALYKAKAKGNNSIDFKE